MMSFGFGAGARGIKLAVVGDAPTVTSIDLDLVDTAGGELRTLTGTNFTGATSVTVGGTEATAFSVISATEIIVVMPAHAAGASQSILVTTSSGTNAANTLYEFWSPAELSLTGYWDRGNYQDVTAGTWPGLASAGSSSGRDLIQATAANQPTEVGLEPDFDGTDDKLGSALTVATFFSASAGSCVALLRLDAAAASTNAWSDAAVFSDAGIGQLGLHVSATDTKVLLNDGGNKVATGASVNDGALHLLMGRWDGVNVGITVDGTAEVTTAAGNLASTAGAILVGTNYASGAWVNGCIRTLLFMSSKISDANYTKLLKWAKACRGLES